MKLLTLPTTLCAVLLTASLAGCGDDGGVPGDAVATVDGVAIERKSFDHWLAITAKTSDRPRAEVRDEVVQQLVFNRWIEAEAKARGVSVDDAAVRQDFERQKELSFPQEAQFQRYLETSGQTEEDILERVRIDLLSSKIRDQVTGADKKVTEQQIADYYNQNKAAFSEPERRDVRVVLTRTRAQAVAAKTALARGASWETVARRHSIDRATRADGGKLLAVTRAEQEKRLGDAMFEARKETLTGPVKVRQGYYVFEVTRVFQPRRQSLEEARATIEKLLVSEGRRKELDAFTEAFREKWRSRTECREGYITPDCGNGPDKPAPAQQAQASQP
jgi:foldase protein PrsA